MNFFFNNSRVKLVSFFFIFFCSVLLIFLFFFNAQKIKCFQLGDFFFDKLLGMNSDCYERKVKGIIYPLVKNLDARYAYFENKNMVNCPHNSTVILISGQSNASNFLKNSKKYKNKHFNYFNGKCYNLSNPVLGAEGEMSSLIPAIATKLNSPSKIIFFTSGRGGMNIKHANHDNKVFINYNKKALDDLEKNNNILKFFVWIQGESDRGNSEHYLDNFTNMFNNITNDLKNKDNINLIITQTSRCFDQDDPKLRKVQKKISMIRNKSIQVINTDKLGNEFRYDKCHYNQKGIEKISFEISKIIKKSLK